jgi:hypothetical protein
MRNRGVGSPAFSSEAAFSTNYVEALYLKIAVRFRCPTNCVRTLFLGIDLLDYASLGHRLRRLSGDGAKRKNGTNGQRSDGFYDDCFFHCAFPCLLPH